MTLHLGKVDAGATLYIPFATYGSAGQSITLTGLAVTDIEIYKNGSVTQRASDAGYALLDTDGIDFDGITGLHGFSLDLSDNTDAGFYSAGGFYWVVVSAVTIDSQTVNFIAATFQIGPVSANLTQVNGAAQTATLDTIKAETASILTDTAEIGAAGAGLTALATAANLATLDGKADDILTDTGTTLPATLATIAGYIDTEIAAILTAIGTPAADLAADIAAVKVDTAAILVDTGTTLQAELDGIQADTEDIQARLPAALTAGGNMKSDALAISGSTESADRLERSTLAIVTGTAAALGSTTSVIASALSPTSAVNDQFVGRIITFDKDTTTTALRGQATDITAYTHATLTFTVTALTTAPAAGDTFTIT